MEILTFKNLETRRSWMLPKYRELRLLFLGDIQLGGETDLRRLKSYVSFARRIGAYVVGMGDYIDVASPSNRILIARMVAEGYDSTEKAIDRAGMGYVREAYDILSPLKGRILGLIRGHHWCQFSGGQGDSTTLLAKMLDTQNAGDCALLNLVFVNPNDPTQQLVCKIWAHHGTGSGMTASSATARLEHITKAFFANIYAMGHQTKKGVSVIPWIDTAPGEDGQYEMNGTNRYIVATGGYGKAYVPGSTDAWGHPAGNYVEKAMMLPTALGSPLALIRPVFEQGRVDINVSV